MPPIPKRSEVRRRANIVPDLTRSEGAAVVRVPPADKDWHPRARAWYLSLRKSGQSRYYEPSDWEFARVLASQLDQMMRLPEPNAALLRMWVEGTRDLMSTEASRRRLHVELTRPDTTADAADDRATADVDNIISLAVARA